MNISGVDIVTLARRTIRGDFGRGETCKKNLRYFYNLVHAVAQYIKGQKWIHGSRCSGKTTALIQISAMTKAPILVVDARRGEIVERMAEQMGLDIPATIAWYEVASKEVMRSEILIDDTLALLEKILSAKILAAVADEPKSQAFPVKIKEH